MTIHLLTSTATRTARRSYGVLGLNALFFSVFLLVVPVSYSLAESAAVETPQPPHLVIEGITNEVVSLIDQYRQSEGELAGETDAKTAEDARFKQFVADVDTAMMKAIDFNWIAFNVMGPYRKTASDAQKQAFAQTFKNSLVETYGRGLLNYGDEEIVLVSPVEALGDKRKATVVQEIRNAEGHYPLEYSMGLNRDGEWKVVNVVINGINLGKTFRNQFVQSAQQHGGDVDQVIANWDVSES